MNRLDRVFAFIFADGCVTNPNSNHPEWKGSNCVMAFCHGEKQEDYLLWKLNQLRILGFQGEYKKKPVRYNKSGSKHDGKVYVSCQVKMKSDRLFTEARKIAYPHNEKTYHQGWVNEQTVDDFALAIWWMDDGGLHYPKKSKDIAGYLYCYCDDQEALYLKLLFEHILDSEVRIHRKSEKHVLYFPVETYRQVMRRISRYVHPTMLYKCAVIVGEDGNPIIPQSAEQLIRQLNELKI